MVRRVMVLKAERSMILLGDRDRELRSYPIRLGFTPVGPKRFMGDGRTPEGDYRIVRRNPASRFYLSLGIDYPSRADREAARRIGKDPGGDIMIHGQPRRVNGLIKADWTEGCVAVANAHMDEIWRYVPTGCPILIRP